MPRSSYFVVAVLILSNSSVGFAGKLSSVRKKTSQPSSKSSRSDSKKDSKSESKRENSKRERRSSQKSASSGKLAAISSVVRQNSPAPKPAKPRPADRDRNRRRSPRGRRYPRAGVGLHLGAPLCGPTIVEEHHYFPPQPVVETVYVADPVLVPAQAPPRVMPYESEVVQFEPASEAVRIMIAAKGSGLKHGHATKLRRPHHKRSPVS